MMSIWEGLPTYLNDHLAGATAARDLIERVAKDAEGTSLGAFLTTLLYDIEADRTDLRAIMRRLDVDERRLEQVVGAVGERAARFKFDVIDRHAGEMNRVLELESMAMGIQGKTALWTTVQILARSEPRLADVDLDRLAARAREQLQEVERRRQELLTALVAA
jgi:hypothetical protein